MTMRELEIKETKNKGRGVFAAKTFKEGEIIEICQIIVLPEEDTELIDKTKLFNYYFNWTERLNRVAIVLGYGSLYNHSNKPNAVYEKDFTNDLLVFKCTCEIKQGEEITVNYYENADVKKPLWFEAKE